MYCCEGGPRHYLRGPPLPPTHHFIGIDLALQPLGAPSSLSDFRLQLLLASYQPQRSSRTMASSQQQWRRGSKLLLLACAVALVLLIAAGSADAVCYSPYTSCSGKCVNLKTDKNNCGYCGYVCKLSSYYKYGETYCSGGKCYSRCKPGWKYNSQGHYCYQ